MRRFSELFDLEGVTPRMLRHAVARGLIDAKWIPGTGNALSVSDDEYTRVVDNARLAHAYGVPLVDLLRWQTDGRLVGEKDGQLLLRPLRQEDRPAA